MKLLFKRRPDDLKYWTPSHQRAAHFTTRRCQKKKLIDWFFVCAPFFMFLLLPSTIGYIWCLFSLFEPSCAARLMFLDKNSKKNPWCDGLNWSLKSENNGKPIEIETEWKDRLFRLAVDQLERKNVMRKSASAERWRFPLHLFRDGNLNLNKSQQHPSWTSLMRTTTMSFNHQRDLCECNARLLCLSLLKLVMSKKQMEENVERNHKS